MKNQKQQKQSIHIYQQGRKTIAQLNQGKEIISMSSAICHPDDKYDFTIGSKIAYERLMSKIINKDIEAKLENKIENLPVVEVKRPAKTGEYIKTLVDSIHGRFKRGDILLVADDNAKNSFCGIAVCYYSPICEGFIIENGKYVVLENYKGKKTFRPFLISSFHGKPYGTQKEGYIGEDTSLADILGNKLKVGDVVDVYKNGSVVKTDVVCKNVVENEDYINEYEGYDFTNGVNKQYQYYIIKNISYKDIRHKAIVNDIMYIKEDEVI
jgi:hypothetical protein